MEETVIGEKLAIDEDLAEMRCVDCHIAFHIGSLTLDQAVRLGQDHEAECTGR